MANEVQILITAEAEQARRVLQGFTGQAQRFGKQAETGFRKATSAFDVFKGALGAGVVLGAINALASGFTNAIGGMINQAKSLEQIENQFLTLTKSTEVTKDVIEDLQNFTATTPFQFEGVARSAQQLLAFGFQTEELIPLLRGLGDAAAGSGTGLNELTLIFGQVRAAGKLTGERLLQLQERAIPIGPALAETLGVAEESIRELVSQGKVSFDDFATAFESLSQAGGPFFEATIRQSKTLGGVLSTLGDNFKIVQQDIGSAFLPVIKEASIALISFIQTNRELIGAFATSAAEVFTASIRNLVSVFQTSSAFISRNQELLLSLAQGVVIATTAFTANRVAILATTIATNAAAIATAAFNLVLRASPFALAVAGATALVVGIKALINNFDFVRGTVLNFASSILGTLIPVLETALRSIASIAGVFDSDLKNSITSSIDDLKRFQAETQASANASIAKANQISQAEQLVQQENANTKGIVKDSEMSQRQEKELTTQAVISGNQKQIESEAKKSSAIQEENARIAEIQTQTRAAQAQLASAIRNRETEEAIKQKEAEIAGLRALENAKTEEERAIAEAKLERIRTDGERETLAKIEAKRLEREELQILAEEFAIADEDQRLLNEELSQANLTAEQEARRQAITKALQAERAERLKAQQQRISDEIKFGTAIASINQVLRSAEIQGVKSATGELVQLQNSRNSSLKAIGKAAAIAQILIKTPESAVNIFNGFSTIPIIGVGLGLAGAASALAFGAEQISNVSRAQFGTIVPGQPSNTDSVPALLSPGEAVFNRRQQQELFQLANGTGAAGGGSSNVTVNVESPTGDIPQETIDNLITAINDRQEFGNAQLLTG